MLAGLCVLVLAACGGSDDGGTDSPASGNDAPDARIQVAGVFDVIYRRNGSAADTVDVRGAGDGLHYVLADGEFHGRFGDVPTRGVARFDASTLGSQCVLARESDDRSVAAKITPAIRFAPDRDCLDNGDHTDTVTWNVAVNGPAAAGRDDPPTITLFRDNDTFGLRAAR